MSVTNNNKATKVYGSDDFAIGVVKEEDFERCVSFLMEHFWPREPLSTGVHLDLAKFEKGFRKKCLSVLSCGTSAYAVYKPTNEIAGLMATQLLTREQSDIYGDMGGENEDESTKMFMVLLIHLEKSVDVFEDPKVDKVLELSFTTVQPKFTGNGLTYRITEECHRLAVELGCQLAVCQSTNQITQHIRPRLGYELRYTLDLASFEVDGKKVVDVGAMGGTTTAKVFTKYLKKE